MSVPRASIAFSRWPRHSSAAVGWSSRQWQPRVSSRAVAEATGVLAGLAASLTGGPGAAPGVDSWEATGLLTVASALTAAAAAREETRGCHWREDHPDSEEDWRVHLDVRLDDDGRLSLTRRPVGTPVVTPW